MQLKTLAPSARYSTFKYPVTLKPELCRTLKVIDNYTDGSGTHDFLLTFHSNHRPTSHSFRDKQPFPSKIANFSYPYIYIYRAPDEGVPLEFGIGARGPECFYDGATYQMVEQGFKHRFSRFDTIPAVTHRPTQPPRQACCRSKYTLCISASRSKN